MSSKHTPGPWELAEKFNCVEVRAVDGPYIANCNQSAAIDWRIKEANARLIAAAPELLNALEYAQAWITEIGDRKGIPNGGTLQTIEAAIAKATGVSHG